MRQVLGNHCVFWSGIATTNQDLGYFQLRSIDSMVLLMYMAVVKREDLFSGKTYSGNLANPLMSDVLLVKMMDFFDVTTNHEFLRFPFQHNVRFLLPCRFDQISFFWHHCVNVALQAKF